LRNIEGRPGEGCRVNASFTTDSKPDNNIVKATGEP